MVKLTKKQRQALFSVFRRDYPQRITPFKRETGDHCAHCGHPRGPTIIERVSSRPYRAFRRLVQPYCDGSGCIMLPWKGMWLGIETDGYTHS